MKAVFNTLRSAQVALKPQLLALAMAAALGSISPASIAASPNINTPQLQSNAPNVYVVKKGDTLWDISGKFLKSPWRWPEIWASNKHVKNPHWIYPGDRLLLCSLNGRPLIGRDEGDGCNGIIQRYSTQVTLRPQVRVEALDDRIPVIPLSNIKQWLERSAIVSAENIANTPYILGTSDGRVVAGVGQNVYVRGKGIVVGQRYAVYRKGEPYYRTDGKNQKEMLGLELQQVASGVVLQTENDVSTLALSDSYNAEVRRGDLVMLEQDAGLPSIFYPTDAEEVKFGGQIIRVMGSISTVGKYGVVTVDRGIKQGAQVGQVFSVYQQGETVKDPNTKEMVKLPNQKIGTLMLFRTFNDLSYGFVLASDLPIKVGAAIEAPSLDQ